MCPPCEHEERVKELEQRVSELEKELAKYKRPAKNSSNSAIPPSQDPYRKYPKRPKTGKKPGGQPGHKGHHHSFVDADVVEPVYPHYCEKCGSTHLFALETYRQICQEVELPVFKPVVTEYRSYEALCQRCGKRNRGAFPKHMNAPVQLGKAGWGLVG